MEDARRQRQTVLRPRDGETGRRTIRLSINLSRDERRILERYGAGPEGRALGNWIRAAALDAALDRMHAGINEHKRREIINNVVANNPFIDQGLDRFR